MFLFDSNRHVVVLLVLLSLLLTACGGLAGEPEIVSTIPPRPTSAPVADVADVADLVIPDNVDLALGAEIYAARCTACHGETGVGDGAMVLNGQIESIPDFTDPATIADQTPADYFYIITNGVLERLMPPWKDALSEDERWAVALYTYNLAGDGATTATSADSSDTTEDSAPLPATTEEAGSQPVATEGAVTSNDGEIGIGIVRGSLTNGTEGTDIPIGQEVVLHIMDMEMNDNTFNTIVDENGAYTFNDVPFIAERGYLVTTEYNGGYFLSDMAFVDAVDDELALDVVVYEATADPSNLHINTMVYQIEVVPDAIQVGQYMVVTNTSDRVYVTEPTSDGELRTSLGIELPQDAIFVHWANDPQRYIVSDDGRMVYDTQAILPGAEHLMQVVYSFDADSEISFNQTLPSPIVGVVDMYASNTAIDLVADDIQALAPQVFGSQMYNGWRFTQNDTQIAFNLEYDANNSGLVGGGDAQATNAATVPQDNLPLGLILVVIGGVTLSAAGVMYFRARREDAAVTGQVVPDTSGGPSTPANELIKQIAELDLQFQNGDIAQDAYEQQRRHLKTQLAQLMKQQASKS